MRLSDIIIGLLLLPVLALGCLLALAGELLLRPWLGDDERTVDL